MVSRAQAACDPADLGACRQRFPASVDAWATILRDHGKFGLDTLLQPAIKAAEEGYVVAPRIAFDWKNQFEKLKNGTNTAALSAAARQAAGRRRRDPSARTWARRCARSPRTAATRSTRARSPRTWWRRLRGIGGLHTLDDFAAHTTETTAPIGTMYKGHDVWQCPPNGPGITMLVMLNILSRFDLTKFPAMSVERFHLEAEAARIAYMMREQYIGDPAPCRCRRGADLVEGIRRRAWRARSGWTGCSICRTWRRR